MEEEKKPTKAEMRAIGLECMIALRAVREKHKGLELVLTYTMPRPDSATAHAIAVVSTIDRPRDIQVMLLGGAREIQENMIDPFMVMIPPDEP